MPQIPVYVAPSGGAFGYAATSDPTAEQTTHVLSGTGGAPTTGTYVTTAAEATLPNSTTLSNVILRGTLAARPAASIAGRLYFTSDTFVLYRDTGAAWVAVSPGLNGSGLVPPSELGSGSADATHYLRGDGTWVVAPGGAPTGSAGGDLGGTYPNPTVISVADITTGTLGLAHGGTSQTSAAAARAASGLNVESRTTFNNVDYNAVATDRYIAQVGTLTGNRTVTLPAANSVNAGYIIWVADESLTATLTNSIQITSAGLDGFNGNGVIFTNNNGFGGALAYISNGTNGWFELGDDFLFANNNLSEITNTTTAKSNLALYNTHLITDANYVVAATDVNVAMIGISAPRTVTLPATSAVPQGYIITVLDASAGVTSTNTITIAPHAGDSIEGDAVIKAANGSRIFITATANEWTSLNIDRLLVSNNLSDLTSASAARAALGLGAIATQGDPLGLTHGGTGGASQQAGMDNLAGAVTSTQYLRGNGTHVVMSAIQAGDVPTLNQNTTGTASNVTGQVLPANGGTGLATLTAHNVLLGEGTSNVAFAAPGSSGQVLTSNGASSDPTFQAAPTGKATLVITDGGTTVASTVASTSMLNGGAVTLPTAIATEALIIEAAGSFLQNNGTSKTYTLNLVMGGTTVALLTTPSLAASASSHRWKLRLAIRTRSVAASVGVIDIQMEFWMTAATSAAFDLIVAADCFVGTSENLLTNNAAYTVDLQVAPSNNSASQTWTCTGAIGERIVP